MLFGKYSVTVKLHNETINSTHYSTVFIWLHVYLVLIINFK